MRRMTRFRCQSNEKRQMDGARLALTCSLCVDGRQRFGGGALYVGIVRFQ